MPDVADFQLGAHSVSLALQMNYSPFFVEEEEEDKDSSTHVYWQAQR